MGFDVSGINPITDRPEPQPQGELCDDIITESQWQSGNYNDGVEIRDDQAVAIADILDEALSTGAIDEYEAQWNKEQKNEKFKYPFEKDNVENFSKFCRLSGGFQIW